MARCINRKAPGLALELSPSVASQVSRTRARDLLSTAATPDTAAIRRDDASRDEDSPLRPPFVRDAEKIMHTPAYNRLSGKTQVFSFRANDDITRRGLHVQLVSRVAKDIGRALGLNLDLIDSIALAHDIGHTPFGHAGEHFLNDAYHERTGRWFFHNVQSVRVLDVLYGRNLTLQTLDGAICHNGEFEQQVLATSDLAGFDGTDGFDAVVERCWTTGAEAISHLRPMTLEGCVVRLADIIAYVGKDRQDAIHAGLVGEDDFSDGLGGGYNAWALSAFVCDIVEHSLGTGRIQMSEEGFGELRRAKRENYEKIYNASEVNDTCSGELRDLFARMYERVLADLEAGDESAPVFRHHIARLDAYLSHYGRTYDWQSDHDLATVDFISSMTDDYFVAYAEDAFPDVTGSFPRSGYFVQ